MKIKNNFVVLDRWGANGNEYAFLIMLHYLFYPSVVLIIEYKSVETYGNSKEYPFGIRCRCSVEVLLKS
jgi:hypothetical protein